MLYLVSLGFVPADLYTVCSSMDLVELGGIWAYFFVFGFEAAGTMRANEFMRGIYSHDVLIPRDSAMYLSNCLQDFFKAYLFQAAAAYNLGLAYFGLFPKLHAVHELSFHLKKDAQRAGYVMNPAVFSCSMDEDFIGRCAAVSRCVSPRIMSKRTLERYLCHIQCAWARN